jgi:hypothetical protein
MQPTNDNLPNGVEVAMLGNGSILPSKELSDLLVDSRNSYDWPAGTGPARSQAVIIALESSVAGLRQSLNESHAHEIVVKVSRWAGNNAKAHCTIVAASQNEKKKMADSLIAFENEASPRNAIDSLANLPGIGLVIATTIYRFCCPAVGAAIDRHASYFFNSLDIILPGQGRHKALAFRREWAKSGKSTSRLATHTPSGYSWNRDQYFAQYLPLLSSIANSLNELNAPYLCAATEKQMAWRPTDVEMGAYFWWACNGAR